MRLPHRSNRAPLWPKPARRAATLGGFALGALLLASPAGAHPGPVDSSGGHYCTAAQNASNLCAPPTYHRHDQSGTQIVVTPGPEAAQLTQTQPDPTQAPAPGTPVPVPVPVPVAAPAPAAPLAHTGPMSWGVALTGIGLGVAGGLALFAHRRMPLPVVLELDRRPLG